MKIVWGALVVDGRGKIGGHVASKNRGGAYMRTKVSPKNERTTAQLKIRSGLTALAQAWRTLTIPQRAAWLGAVENYQQTDVFGSSKTPSGINLYIKLNQNLKLVNQPVLTAPLLPVAVVPPSSLTATAGAALGTLSIAFTGAPTVTDTSWVISATPQLSPGKNYVKNLFRVLVLQAATGTSPFTIGTEYVAKYGNLVQGQKIFVQVVAISNTTGQKSLPVQTEVIIGA